MRTATRTVAEAARRESRVKDRLQDLQQSLLDQPIQDRRDAQHPLPAPGLRDHHPPHRLRSIAVAEQLLPMSRPVLAAVLQKLLDRQAVDSRRSTVTHYPLMRRHQVRSAQYLLHEACRPVTGVSSSCRTRLSRRRLTLGGAAAYSPALLRHLSLLACDFTRHRTAGSGSALSVRPFIALH